MKALKTNIFTNVFQNLPRQKFFGVKEEDMSWEKENVQLSYAKLAKPNQFRMLQVDQHFT